MVVDYNLQPTCRHLKYSIVGRIDVCNICGWTRSSNREWPVYSEVCSDPGAELDDLDTSKVMDFALSQKVVEFLNQPWLGVNSEERRQNALRILNDFLTFSNAPNVKLVSKFEIEV